MKQSLVSLLLILSFNGAESDGCTICKGGADALKNPERTIYVPGFEHEQHCGSVDLLLGILIPNASSPECDLIQSFGSLCGCEQEEIKDRCQSFCPNNIMGFPRREIPFMERLLGFVPTCEMLKAHIEYTQTQGSDYCSAIKTVFDDYCGCGLIDVRLHEPCSMCGAKDVVPSLLNKELELGSNYPIQTCAELHEASILLWTNQSDQCNGVRNNVAVFCGCPVPNDNPCDICSDGNPVGLPEKRIPFLNAEELVNPFFAPTCGMLEARTKLIDANHDKCKRFQQLGSGFCGCTPVENHCEFCPQEPTLDPEFKGKAFYPLGPHFGFVPSCEIAVSSLQYQMHADDPACWAGQYRSDLCGCNNGEFDYFGANTPTKRALLSWIPRSSAILATLGSFAIMLDVIRDKMKRKQVYNHLLFGMSLFGCIQSIAWALNTLPIPRYDQNGNEWPVYGVSGTEATCAVQGFFLQLGLLASVWYNASLATYYALIIVRGWREIKLNKWRIWMHVVPLIIGISLALGGIPFYDANILVCHIPVPPNSTSMVPNLLLVQVPSLTALLVATIMMVTVHRVMRRRKVVLAPMKKTAQDNHLEVGGDDNDDRSFVRAYRIEREVFWQSTFYLGALYITLPIFVYGVLVDSQQHGRIQEEAYYGLFLVLHTLLPFQGALNAMIYFRPRVWRHFARRRHVGEEKMEPKSSILQEMRGSILPFDPRFAVHTTTQQSRSSFFDLVELDAKIEPSALIASEIEEEKLRCGIQDTITRTTKHPKILYPTTILEEEPHLPEQQRQVFCATFQDEEEPYFGRRDTDSRYAARFAKRLKNLASNDLGEDEFGIGYHRTPSARSGFESASQSPRKATSENLPEWTFMMAEDGVSTTTEVISAEIHENSDDDVNSEITFDEQ